MIDGFGELKDAGKSFSGFKLNDISLSLPKGYIMGLVGPNGAGKTRTIQLILNMLEKDAGEILVFGKDNIKNENAIKQDIGVLFTKQAAATFADIEGMAKKTIGGNIQLSPADWKTISGLAKEGVVSRGIIPDLKKQLSEAKKEIRSLKDAFSRLLEETKLFREAVKLAPKRIKDVIEDVFQKHREQREAARTPKRKNKDVHR